LAPRQPPPCGAGILEDPGLVGFTFAFAVTTVVEDHDRHLMAVVQHLQHIGVLRDVPGVAMSEEYSNHWLLVSAVPAVQPGAIIGSEPGVFKFAAGSGPIPFRIPGRKEDV